MMIEESPVYTVSPDAIRDRWTGPKFHTYDDGIMMHGERWQAITDIRALLLIVDRLLPTSTGIRWEELYLPPDSAGL